MFPRPKYLNAIKPFMNTDLIKVITGIRRCGKSTLLDLIKQQLELDGVDPMRLISFKMESMEFDGITDYRELYQVIRKKIEGIENPYLFFDELQNVDGWERAINSLRVDLPCDIYITGSNAFLLSSEISTLISGRYVEIPMQTLTFSEYLSFREANWAPNGDKKSDIAILPDGSFQTLRRLFNDYMQYGGFPYLAQIDPDREVCSAYTRDLVQTIITRDILTREGRRGLG